MPALGGGKAARDFSLPTLQGEMFSLHEALRRGPVLLAFFKISCPVCQFTFPYLERLYKGLSGEKVSVVGVSQNNEKDTAAFAREYGITFPIALDDRGTYPVSNAYGLTHVPTLFYVNADGRVNVSSVGWSRADVDEIARKAAEEEKIPAVTIFNRGEAVPDFRGG